MARVEIRTAGDSLTYDYSGSSILDDEISQFVLTQQKPVHREDYSRGFTCVLDDVDLKNGGTYEIEVEGGNGSCKLEIFGVS